jgi:hypothetical protein
MQDARVNAGLEAIARECAALDRPRVSRHF